MPTVSIDDIAQLQHKPHFIRNLCVLAHVDHGKTTLCDLLIASNGIISTRLAGKIRYLDSREDEQIRGITMKSSAISLLLNQHLFNLIDSPGHVDFSSEVSTSLRLCDGAFVLVDVIEGICSQTHDVLRQAYMENVKPCLIITKMDKMITELRLTPTEAYQQLQNILEQVNAVMATFIDWVKEEENKQTVDDQEGAEALFFHPEKGNVLFASAIDGWAFDLDTFAKIHGKRLNIHEDKLKKMLWGDYYLDPKTKRVLTKKSIAAANNLKPMFIQFILDNIFAIYDAASLASKGDSTKIEKIVNTLKIKVLPRDTVSKDSKVLIQKVFGQWIPLASKVLQTAITYLPSPVEAQKNRIGRILYSSQNDENSMEEDVGALASVLKSQDYMKIQHDMENCNPSEQANSVVYISKMFAVPIELLPGHKRVQLTAEQLRERHLLAKQNIMTEQKAKQEHEILSKDHSKEGNGILSVTMTSGDQELGTEMNSVTKIADLESSTKTTEETFIAFARVFSGTIRHGQKLHVLGPKYDPRLLEVDQRDHIHEFVVDKLFLLMGRDLEELKEVPAGNICGLSGLEKLVFKSATLSQSTIGPLFSKLYFQGAPILRVAVEPSNPMQMSKLIDGLRLLNQADPAVEVLVQETGEHVILAAGELHLERCIKDLKERFAKIDIKVSTPIVPFRESITKRSDIGSANIVQLTTSNRLCKIDIRAMPIPEKITNFLEKNQHHIQTLFHQKATVENDNETTNIGMETFYRESSDHFIDELKTLLKQAGGEWAWVFDNIISFGPKRVGPNILISKLGSLQRSSPWWRRGAVKTESIPDLEKLVLVNHCQPTERDYETSIITGFQLATNAGPLCEEPMRGVAFILEEFILMTESLTEEQEIELVRLTGQLIFTMKEACREAFMQQSPRLMLSMYSCSIQAIADVLGKVYGVISKRRGRITNEELREGTPFFYISAMLPVIESFGFADDIRKKTSGSANPQLIFAGWEVLDEDPFWTPKTKEELEELGEKADRANLALKYMNTVRRRKGLKIEEKMIEHAEKQRTLMRK